MNQHKPTANLAKYSLAVGAILIGAQSSSAQIHHTSLGPEVLQNSDYEVIMDGSKRVTINNWSTISYRVNWLNMASDASFANDGYDVVPLSQSIQVKTLSTFKASWGNLASIYFSSTYGQFAGAINKYMGLRFAAATGGYHYGWIQINIPTDASSCSITSYAWADANEPIQTGQIPEPTGLGLLACGAVGIMALHRKNK